ncbi:MAG: caspase family protein, partial [Symploca sp. SIO1A3]|nr:caspase family protein [Symploca sp. SIO1A3]
MIRDALVVGINTYQYSDLRNLQAPAEDAEAIAQRLEQDGEFRVWRLPEAIHRETHQPFVGKKRGVKLSQLKQALVKLFLPEGNSIPDTGLFYFSGHGLRKTLGIPEGFLATSDVNPDVEFNGLSLKWLRELLRKSPIKQQIVWLDCCHSGELLNFQQEADPGEQGKGRDRCFIAASREFELSFEEIGSDYSVLTKVL